MTVDEPRGHMCPMCKVKAAPIFWAVCAGCHHILPAALAAALVHAWRHRITNPGRWVEALATALIWRQANGTTITPAARAPRRMAVNLNCGQRSGKDMRK